MFIALTHFREYTISAFIVHIAPAGHAIVCIHTFVSVIGWNTQIVCIAISTHPYNTTWVGVGVVGAFDVMAGVASYC